MHLAFRASALLLAAGAPGLRAAALALVLACPLAAQAPVRRSNVATLPFEDGLIVLDAHSDGRVVIGASHGDSTIAVSLPAEQVKLWADSTARLLARRVRKSSERRSYRSSVVNHEIGGGVSFTRHVTAGESVYRLYFANTTYGGFPFDLSRDEGGIFVHSLREAVRRARELSAPRKKQ